MRLLDQIRGQRDDVRQQLDSLFECVAERGDDLTEAEETNSSDLQARLVTLDARLEQLSALELRNAEAASLATRVQEANGRPSPVRVTSEESTYSERSEHSFFVDAYRSTFVHDPNANDRLARHMREATHERAVGTADFTGLVIPNYLVDLFTPLARAGRISSDAVRHEPLPDSGQTVSVPKLAVGTDAGSQHGQNTAITNRDASTAMETVQVVTIAGEQTLSRQAMERGGGIDRIIYADLVKAYAQELNRQVLDGLGESEEEHLGILRIPGTIAVDFTDASPEVPGFYKKLAEAISLVNTERFSAPNAQILAPRRWGWISSESDTTGRPLVLPSAQVPVNAAAAVLQRGNGLVASMQTLDTFSDPSMPVDDGAATPTDTEKVAVICSDDLILFEENGGVPRQLRFDPGPTALSVRLVAYGYSAFLVRHPKAIALISGTGLSEPTFE